MTYLPINGPIPPTAFGLQPTPTAQTKANELCRQMDALIAASQEISARITATKEITDFEDYLMEMLALSVQASALTARAVLFAAAEIPPAAPEPRPELVEGPQPGPPPTCAFCGRREAIVPKVDLDICERCLDELSTPWEGMDESWGDLTEATAESLKR